MNTKIFALAAALSIASLPSLAQTNAMQNQDTATQLGGESEAIRMVAARAALVQSLDAKKATPGSEFRLRLAGNVQLNNGPKLPSGTMLMGNVVQDDSQNSANNNGTSKLTIRFTEAELKDGTVVPIKATIVGVSQGSDANDPTEAGNQVPDGWTNRTLGVEEIGVLNHVDLHSRIASNNSGVFVATDNRDIKLQSGTEMELAIATRANEAPQQSGN